MVASETVSMIVSKMQVRFLEAETTQDSLTKLCFENLQLYNPLQELSRMLGIERKTSEKSESDTLQPGAPCTTVGHALVN